MRLSPGLHVASRQRGRASEFQGRCLTATYVHGHFYITFVTPGLWCCSWFQQSFKRAVSGRLYEIKHSRVVACTNALSRLLTLCESHAAVAIAVLSMNFFLLCPPLNVLQAAAHHRLPPALTCTA
jgi:hypothetical protein